MAAKPGISEFSGRLRFNVSQGIQRIDGLLERLAIEGGSHDERLAVFRRVVQQDRDAQRYQLLRDYLLRNGIIRHVALSKQWNRTTLDQREYETAALGGNIECDNRVKSGTLI